MEDETTVLEEGARGPLERAEESVEKAKAALELSQIGVGLAATELGEAEDACETARLKLTRATARKLVSATDLSLATRYLEKLKAGKVAP